MRSHVKPIRSSAPGAKFSTSTSQCLTSVSSTFLPFGVLGVERDRALVVVQHREVEAVHVRDVAQLAARDVAGARALDLDHVGAEPGEQLRARRPRLHVREVQDLDAVQCLAHSIPLCLAVVLETRRSAVSRVERRRADARPSHVESRRNARAALNVVAPTLASGERTNRRRSNAAQGHGFFLAEGLRLVMRPLSVPAFSSMTALISVGLRERIAASIAPRSSAGVLASTPTPPKASISFS